MHGFYQQFKIESKMLTLEEYLSDLIKFQVLGYIRGNMSAFLQSRIKELGLTLFSVAELNEYPLVLDFTNETNILESDMVGLNYFNNLKNLTFPSAGAPAITRGMIDVGRFLNLEVLKTLSINIPFRGNMSVFTKLTTFYIAISDADMPRITPVVLSNNVNLEEIRISTNQTFTWPVSSIGNLSGLTKLRSYTLLNASNIPTATINNILTTARAAKTAGAPLTVVSFVGCKAPTGGAGNADALWLSANGVTVTLGTA